MFLMLHLRNRYLSIVIHIIDRYSHSVILQTVDRASVRIFAVYIGERAYTRPDLTNDR